MGYYLFEDPTMGIVLGVAVEIFLLISWMFMRERFNRLVLLAGPAVMGLFILLDVLVDTNREQLTKTTRQIINAAEEENAEVIIGLLSDNLLINNSLDKDMVGGIIKWHLSKPLIAANYTKEILVKSHSDQAGQVEFEVTTNLDPKSSYGVIPLVKSQWRFEYVRDPDGKYRVKDMVMLKLGEDRGIDVFRKQKLNSGL
jgi:hypothetical protein